MSHTHTEKTSSEARPLRRRASPSPSPSLFPSLLSSIRLSFPLPRPLRVQTNETGSKAILCYNPKPYP